MQFQPNPDNNVNSQEFQIERFGKLNARAEMVIVKGTRHPTAIGKHSAINNNLWEAVAVNVRAPPAHAAVLYHRRQVQILH